MWSKASDLIMLNLSVLIFPVKLLINLHTGLLGEFDKLKHNKLWGFWHKVSTKNSSYYYDFFLINKELLGVTPSSTPYSLAWNNTSWVGAGTRGWLISFLQGFTRLSMVEIPLKFKMLWRRSGVWLIPSRVLSWANRYQGCWQTLFQQMCSPW